MPPPSQMKMQCSALPRGATACNDGEAKVRRGHAAVAAEASISWETNARRFMASGFLWSGRVRRFAFGATLHDARPFRRVEHGPEDILEPAAPLRVESRRGR